MGESVNEAMRSRFQTFLSNTVGTGTSQAYSIEPYYKHSVQTVIAGTATVNYRVSVDGTNYHQIVSTTSSTIQSFLGKYRSIVANVSAISGTVSSVILSGI